jgi:TP901 family phage tail tape measure protein
MAERKISTRLVLEGEKDYKASITNINRELKTLESALKLTESNFKGQANTMAALEAKNKALNDVIGKTTEKLNAENTALDKAKAAKSGYAEAAQKAREQLDNLKKTTDDATKETEEYKKQVEQVQAEINKYEAAEQKAAAAVETHSQKANNAQIALNDLNGQLADNEKYLDEAKQSTDGAAKSTDEFGKQTEKAGKKSEEFGEKSSEAIEGLAAALAAAGLAAAINEIVDALKACSEASIGFESAMAGVAKTTELSQDELAAMGEAIKEITLTVPVTASEFAKIAEVAGQLGIEKENLLDFSTVMANLGVATNMTSEEAATMLAQFAAITGMDASGFGRLGSVIVALGNNFATNEKKITDMAQGIAGAGTNAKISEADMMALSAAVTSLGIETQAGATSMSKLIQDMGTAVETGNDLTAWADAAGMSASEFAALWGTDATAAISAFLGNLNKLNDSSTVTLSNLGITETRMVRMITSLANAEDKTGLLTKALNTSNGAWEENVALVKEAETRYKTTESQIKLYKNSLENLKIAVGDQLNPALADLAGIGKNINDWATEFIKKNKAIIPILTGVVIGLGVFTTALTVMTAVTLPKVIEAFTLLQTVLMSNPWILVATGIAAVATAIGLLIANANDGTKAAQEFTKELETTATAHEEAMVSIDQQEASTGALVERLNELIDKTSRTAAENAELQGIIDELNGRIKGLNLSYDANTGALNKNVDSIRDLIKARYDQIRADEAMQRAIEIIGEKAKVEDELTKALMEQEAALLKYNAAMERYNEVSNDPLYAGQVGGFYSAVVEAEIALTDANAAVGEHLNSLSKLDQEYSDVTGSLEGYVGAAGNAAAGTQGLQTVTEESVNSIQERLGALSESYQEAYEAAYNSITSTISGFSEMAETVPADIQTVMDALDSQDDYIDTYMENLAKAAEMGLDEGLLAELSDGSVESANILQGIVDDGGEKIQELNEKFREVQQGKDDFANIVAEMQTNFAESAGEIVTEAETMVANLNLELAAYAAGSDTIQGYIDGLNSKIQEAKNILDGLGVPSSSGGGESHAQGIDRVPHDGYRTVLHEDEMVLNRARASEYRAEQRARQAGVTNNNTKTVINHNSFFVPTKQAYDDIAQYIDRKWGE